MFHYSIIGVFRGKSFYLEHRNGGPPYRSDIVIPKVDRGNMFRLDDRIDPEYLRTGRTEIAGKAAMAVGAGGSHFSF